MSYIYTNIRRYLFAAILFTLVILPLSSFAAIRTVTNCKDDGSVGSLRWALNALPSGTQIKFNIKYGVDGVGSSEGATSPGLVTNEAGTDRWYRIIVNSALPPVSADNIQISGSTQPTGDTANTLGPEVEIRATINMDVFQCNANHLTIEGLAINNIVTSNCLMVHLIPGADYANVYGCYIGTTATGEALPAGHSIDAIYGMLLYGVKYCRIGSPDAANRNVISGSQDYGIYLSSSSSNEVIGNNIGTNANGFSKIGNNIGVYILNSGNNWIGGDTLIPGMNKGNIISGNSVIGIKLAGSLAKNNHIIGNLIGTDANGTVAMANGTGVVGQGGIAIVEQANGNYIGDGTSSGRNIISGNNPDGIYIVDTGTDNNAINGNYIGTKLNGMYALANSDKGIHISYRAKYNKVGDVTAGVPNVISGNPYGIWIEDTFTDSNEVIGNYIGTKADGASALPNNYGLWLCDEAKYNMIGNGTPGGRNVISGNIVGIMITAAGASNEVLGNYIGVSADGTTAIANTHCGLWLTGEARYNMIGNGTPGGRNIISGNSSYGIYIDNSSYNKVFGNYIGTNASGEAPIANVYGGLMLQLGAKYNKIGDGSSGGRNIISGNTNYGIVIYGSGTNSNEVAGNYIGVNQAGTTAVPNGFNGVSAYRCGIWFYSGPQFSSIESNIISGNMGPGIRIMGYLGAISNNKVSNNKIGTGTDGSLPIPNTEYGILIYPYQYGPGQVVQNTIGPSNIIANNGNTGISLESTYVTTQTITRNSIYNNTGSGISLINSANGNIGTAVITSADYYMATGTAEIRGTTSVTNPKIEVFKAQGSQGKEYLPGTVTLSPGNWKWTGSPQGGFAGGELVCATQTDQSGNTSQFSATRAVNVAVPHGVVTNCNDTGDGSLRQVMMGLAAGDAVIFDLTAAKAGYSTGEAYPGLVTNEAGTGGPTWFRIILNSSLPAITAANVQILGSTQTKEATNTPGPKVEVRAKDGVFNVFECTGGYLTIEGLAINRCGWEGGTAIYLQSGADNAHIYKCFIGTTATGDALAPKKNTYGVYIGASTNCHIGGMVPAQRNVIGGNQSGIYIGNSSTNEVKGNYVGISASGYLPLGNDIGIQIAGNSNIIGGNTSTPGTDEGNIISGNSISGVRLYGPSAINNYVIGNLIGTDPGGTIAMANGFGVYLEVGAQNNKVGDVTVGGRNVISGNTYAGIYMTGESTSSNEVLDNYIGTNAGGTSALPNLQAGVCLFGGAHHNRIGDGTVNGFNVISGNGSASVGTGITMAGPGTNSNEVLGNNIGTNTDGSLAIENRFGIYLAAGARYNKIGSKTAPVRNIISGNIYYGISMQDPGTDSNNVIGNYIGTNAGGTTSLPNGSGLYLGIGARDNRIGDGTVDGRNIISGNSSCGIVIEASGTNSNEVLGNYIGTNAGGSLPVANALYGLVLRGGAKYNKVGDGNAGGLNVISGNMEGIHIEGSGTDSNVVAGNYIGTNAGGTSALANTYGLFITNGARYNRVGDRNAVVRNVISGNENGIRLMNSGTNSNEIVANYIGVNSDATTAIKNTQNGVMIDGGVNYSTIEGNIISGNKLYGILIQGSAAGPISNNKISSNEIGTSHNGTFIITNEGCGILISSSAAKHIFQNTIGPSNIIAYNGSVSYPAGISISGSTVTSEMITRNYIYSNFGSGISLTGNANNGIPDPVISTAELSGTTLTVSGTSQANADVEVFKASGNQGETYLITTSDATGNWKWTGPVSGFSSGSGVCVTQTDKDGNTSQFSATREVIVKTPHGVVTNCNDSGDGSLRQVLTDIATGESVIFNITTTEAGYSTGEAYAGLVTNEAGTGGPKWFRIILKSALPAITAANVQILGSTQPAGEAANVQGPKVEVRMKDGNFTIFGCKGGGVTIEGLAINRTGADGGAGISLESGADNAHIYKCYIGTTATGEAPAPKKNSYGIRMDDVSGCRIGGSDPAQRNVIGGNGIGIITRNSSANEIFGNYIGISATGLLSVGNDQGVFLYTDSQKNWIGDGTDDRGNVISGNTSYGIVIGGSGTNSNEVLGNYIGVDRVGILIGGGANYSTIKKNIISGNEIAGVYIQGSAGDPISNSKISNNEVVTNEGYGIIIVSYAGNPGPVFLNTIGPDNIIANNGGPSYPAGISVEGQYVTSETITQNSIYNNYGIGISLIGGANHMSGNTFSIDTPEITEADYDPVSGYVYLAGNGFPKNNIEIFKAKGNQGKEYLVNTTVDPFLFWELYKKISGVKDGDWLCVTQTDKDGNTSQFSATREVIVKSPHGVVTNCNDSGDGSLRQVLTDIATGESVIFNITTTEAGYSTGEAYAGLVTNEAGTGGPTWFRIILNSALPAITAANVQILGSTQPAGEATNMQGPKVEVRAKDGNFAVFTCKGNAITIEGLAVNRCGAVEGGYAIDLEGGASNSHIYGCYIGTTATGEARAPTRTSYGIAMNNVSNCTIGGPVPAQRNVISGNFIGIGMPIGSNNNIKGNYIGISASGSLALGNVMGTHITGNNTIGGDTSIPGTNDGNVISGNSQAGIYVNGVDRINISILGNLIGTDPSGTKEMANGSGNADEGGIIIDGGASGNYIGNGTSQGRNIISGNRVNGILIDGSVAASNEIKGNFIGTDIGGNAALSNIRGISIKNGSKNNKIGGMTSGWGNVISGNTGCQIFMQGPDTDSNEVTGNNIGVDKAGTAEVAGNGEGLYIAGGVNYSSIEGNVISGNNGAGISMFGIVGGLTTNNRISSNEIGTGQNGTLSIPNTSNGIYINNAELRGPVRDNTIGPKNIIANNKSTGIYISGMNIDSETITQNSIYDNISLGIGLSGSALIVGTAEILSASYESGQVLVTGTSLPGATVEIFKAKGNQGKLYLDTTSEATGAWTWEKAVPGLAAGDHVVVTQTFNRSTSQFSATREVIVKAPHGVVTNCNDSGDGSLRQVLTDIATGDSVVFKITVTDAGYSTGEAYPGLVTDESGAGSYNTWFRIMVNSTLPAITAANVQILGSTQTKEASNALGPSVEVRANGAFDVFKCTGRAVTIEGLAINRRGADGGSAVRLESGADGARIYKCYIGTTATGEGLAPQKSFEGINMQTVSDCRIGSTDPANKNVVCGQLYDGMILNNSFNNEVIGNYIGISAQGSLGLGNQTGIYVSNSSRNNYIGKQTSVPGTNGGNVISGNSSSGISFANGAYGNHVYGNLIGTNPGGTTAVPNNTSNLGYKGGIGLSSGSNNNHIGDGTDSGRNVISGNAGYAVYLQDSGTDSNEVFNNCIGVNLSGTGIPNRCGIGISSGAKYSIIRKNIISRNSSEGILVQGSGGPISNNTIVENTIGNNGSFGIYIIAHASTDPIFLNTIGPSNIIVNNSSYGILLNGQYITSETITQNPIYDNTSSGIWLASGANTGIGTAEILSAGYIEGQAVLTGTATAGATVEIFKAKGNQGEIYLGTTSEAAGVWTWKTGSGLAAGNWACVTQTLNGNTSPFSATREVTIIASYEPDAMVGLNSDGTGYRYAGVFEDPPATQVQSREVVVNQTAEAYFKLLNAGSAADSLIVTGDASSGGFTVRYFEPKTGAIEVTDIITSGAVMPLTVGASREIRAEISYNGTVTATKEIILTAGSINVASKDAVKAIITFTAMPPSPYRPDGMIGTLESGLDYNRERVYEDTPATQVRSRSVPANEKAVFYYKLKNQGIYSNFRINAEAGGGFIVRYFDATIEGRDITADLTSGRDYPRGFNPRDYVEFRIEIFYGGTSLATKEITIIAMASSDQARKDAVKAVATFLPSSGVSSYEMVHTPKAISGEAFRTTISAKKADGSVQASIRADVSLSVDSGSVTPGAISASSFSSGVCAANIKIFKMGDRTLTVSDGYSSGSLVIPVYNAFRVFSGTELGIPGLTVTLPAGTTTSETDAAVTAVEVTDLPGSPPPGYSMAGKMIDIRPSGAVFLLPLTLTLPLTGPPADPRVYYWDGSKWSADGITVVSYTSDSITFTTTHFSVFAPMSALASNLVRFGPNPYNPRSGTAGVIWYWLAADVSTSVYVIDVAGRLVWKQSFFAGMSGAKAGANSVPFDGKNQSGDILGDGIYLYKIIQGGRSIGGGKIAIVK